MLKFKNVCFQSFFKDLTSIQSVLLQGRERGQKGPSYAEAAL